MAILRTDHYGSNLNLVNDSFRAVGKSVIEQLEIQESRN